VIQSQIEQLKESFKTTLAECLDGATQVALLDFPLHRNCGDSLIYLGELAALKEMGVKILAVSEASSFRAKDYLSLPTDTVMLFHGGGNFGVLWDLPHLRRNEELAQLSGFKAILLPQTMTEMDDACQHRTRTILAGHPDVTLMWRDRASFEASRRIFPEIPSLLIPDAAFCLHPYSAPKVTLRPRDDIKVLARLDRESSGLADHAKGIGARVHDWTPLWIEKAIRKFLTMAIRAEARLSGPPRMRTRMILYRLFAQNNAASAARQLSSARVIVVDRLHAWLLGLLLDIPHLVVETRFGKIRRVMASWLPEELSTLTEDMGDLIPRAHQLLLQESNPSSESP